MGSLSAPVFTWEQLRKVAKGYLAQKHPSGAIPIPIEEILDLQEKIDIVELEGLSVSGHEAFTSRDRKTVYVDKGVYRQRNPHRLRYTLAHELSHILIHPFVFEAADYRDIDGFKYFLDSIPPDVLKTIEAQAYNLAGLLLVPSSDLAREYAEVAEALKKRGVSITTLPSEPLRRVAKIIGDKFKVSSQVIHRRAVREGLWQWEDIQNP